MDGPYLNSLIPIVGGVAASAWAAMSSVTTPTVTTPRLYHASALVSSFMVFSLASSHVRTLHHRRRSMRFRKGLRERMVDRKSTRLNSSHLVISYAVFCLKKKKRERSHCQLTQV